MESLINLLGRFSKYELINNLIPGVALCYILTAIGYHVLGDDWLVNAIVSYFVGMSCCRFSSLCIEEPFKKWKWIKWRGYDEYNRAKTERPFIALLQENANMYRCMAAVFILAIPALGYYHLRQICPCLSNIETPLLIILLALLYIFSYIKQVNDFLIKNIDEVNNG